MKKRWIAIIVLMVALLTCSCSNTAKEEPAAKEEPKEAQDESKEEEPESEEPESEEPAVSEAQETVGTAVGTKVEITPEIQYESNIFLSNFIEQKVPSVDTENWTGNEFAKFIVSYAYINEGGMALTGNDQYLGMTKELSKDLFQEKMVRFFGFELSDEKLNTLPISEPSSRGFAEDGSPQYYYDGNKIYTVAAFGGTVHALAVVDQILEFEDGQQEMQYKIYEIDIARDGSVGGLNVTKEDYMKTPEEAESDEWYNLIGSGTALVRPKNIGDRNTYEVISLESNYS